MVLVSSVVTGRKGEGRNAAAIRGKPDVGLSVYRDDCAVDDLVLDDQRVVAGVMHFAALGD